MRLTKILSLFLVFIFLLTIPVNATSEDGIQPRYKYILTFGGTINIQESTGIATCSGYMSAYGNYPVKMECRLQRFKNNNWETVKTWEKSSSICISMDDLMWCVSEGYIYRIAITAYVYNSSGAQIDEANYYKTINYGC